MWGYNKRQCHTDGTLESVDKGSAREEGDLAIDPQIEPNERFKCTPCVYKFSGGVLLMNFLSFDYPHPRCRLGLLQQRLLPI